MEPENKDPNFISAASSDPGNKQEKKMMGGSFAVSLIFHGIVLLIIGSIVIVPGAVRKLMPVASVVTAPVQIPEPPKVEESTPMDPSPDAGGSPITDQQLEESSTTQDPAKVDALVVDSAVATSPRLDASAGASSFTGDVFKQGSGRGGSGGGTGSGIGRGSGKGTSFFGSKEKADSTLVGRFFDLKQTPQGQPTPFANAPCIELPDLEAYFKVQEDFIHDGWNEEILNKYYHAPMPLYATQFWVPKIPSEEAPKAFSVEKECQGGFWLAHYKGRVVPPKDGTYRFVGYSDCQIIIAVNKKIVLASGWWKDRHKHLNLTECPLVENYFPNGQGGLRAGRWMSLRASEPVDLDILWGDNGGVCMCYLLIEEKGATYTMEKGHPILPVFQLAPNDTPVAPDAPKFATGFPTWKGK